MPVVVSAKLVAPEILTLEMFNGRGSPPELVTVADMTALVVPTLRVLKFKLAGDTIAMGACNRMEIVLSP